MIWGSRGSDVRQRIIHPRITVIPEKYVPDEVASQHFDAQIIDEIKLPLVLVNRPIFLIHFVIAQSYYNQYQFEKAITEFEKCLNQPQEDIDDETDIRFWVAITLQCLGKYRGKKEYLEKAIELYHDFWNEQDFTMYWAKIQNNLGIAYSDLPTRDLSENLHRAIACYEQALSVYTERDFPLYWAMTQNNLGAAYHDLPTGDWGENLKRAITFYEQALRIRTEQDFPVDWAQIQNNLGVAYKNLPAENRKENLQRAVQCFQNALKIWTEDKFLYDYNIASRNLKNTETALASLKN